MYFYWLPYGKGIQCICRAVAILVIMEDVFLPEPNRVLTLDILSTVAILVIMEDVFLPLH